MSATVLIAACAFLAGGACGVLGTVVAALIAAHRALQGVM